jgi:hypothetical protein
MKVILMTRFGSVSLATLCSISVMSCKSRSFNLTQTKSAPPPAGGVAASQAQLVEDLVSRAFISQAGVQEALEQAQDIASGNAKGNICIEAIPKLSFDGENIKTDLPGIGFFSMLSHLSYETVDVANLVAKKMGFSEAVLLEDLSTSSKAYLYVHDKYLVLGFAGTKEPNDILTDIDLLTTKTLFGYGVHKGFLRAYMGDYETDASKPAKPRFEGIRGAVLEALPKYGYPAKKVFITGHSLGAGLGTLLAANLAVKELTNEGKNLPDSCDAVNGPVQSVGGVFNFASSRVGGHDFAACYQKLLGSKTYRVVNDQDFLPYLPDGRFYKHVGQRVFLDKDANITFEPNVAEETKSSFFDFLKVIAKGGLSKNILDHLNYTIKITHALEPSCPSTRKSRAKSP